MTVFGVLLVALPLAFAFGWAAGYAIGSQNADQRLRAQLHDAWRRSGEAVAEIGRLIVGVESRVSYVGEHEQAQLEDTLYRVCAILTGAPESALRPDAEPDPPVVTYRE